MHAYTPLMFRLVTPLMAPALVMPPPPLLIPPVATVSPPVKEEGPVVTFMDVATRSPPPM